MKSGKSLTELATELQRIAEVKRDLVLPQSKMGMDYLGNLNIPDLNMSLPPTAHTHAQLAAHAEIPKAYYDRLKRENAALLAENVNHSLSRDPGEKRMIRTLDGQARAWLSPRYRILDSHDLFSAVLPELLNQPQVQIKSSEITPTRAYLSVVLPRLEGEVAKGDVVQYGLTISTSDVGAGSLRVEPLIYRLICTNGMIASTALRKYHVGRNSAEGDDIRELLSDQTQRLTDAAFWAQVRDLVRASMKPEVFEREILRLRRASEQRITNFNLEQVVELTNKSLSVNANAETKQSILEYLAKGADGAGLTQWGLANAYTFAANNVADYDDSVNLMRTGGEIIDLKPNDWKKIAEAVA